MVDPASPEERSADSTGTSPSAGMRPTSPEERTAAPPKGARWLAFASILVGGLCGGLIGFAYIDLQCEGDCGPWTGLGALVGAVAGAVGLAVVAILTLRAMDEWRRFGGRRQDR